MGLMALTLWGTRAGADVTSDRPGSIVIWPKVIADGTRDTIIELTNTGNSTAYAHCWYTQGTGVCSLTPDFCSLTTSNSCPPITGGPPNTCIVNCETRDFDVVLTHQQPTFWRVSTGRFEDLLSGSGTSCTTFPTTPPSQSCPGIFQGNSTVSPGAVPPAPFQANSPADFGGFRGELRCIETASDGSPFAGDHLKGEAVIEGVEAVSDGADLSEYNSINVRGTAGGGAFAGEPLQLNGFDGFNACPRAIDIIHYARNASDIAASGIGATCIGGSCPVQTDFTIVPCRRDFENVIPTGFNVDFEAKDEFESNFSREIPFECWADGDLATLGFTNVNSATFFRTRATSTGSGLCIAGSDITTCNNSPATACTSQNAAQVCPPGGACINTFCRVDADCGTGGVCGPATGILAVVEEFHATARTITDAALVGSAAANTHSVDASDLAPRPAPIGNGPLERLGHCRGNLTQQCANDTDCGPGLCRNSGASCTSDAACGPNDFCDQCMNDEITPSGF
jgi:hypothetical protein